MLIINVSRFKYLVIFAITIKNYIILKMSGLVKYKIQLLKKKLVLFSA
jgi:hypothetical protein